MSPSGMTILNPWHPACHRIKFDELYSTSILVILCFFPQKTSSIVLCPSFLLIQITCTFGGI